MARREICLQRIAKQTNFSKKNCFINFDLTHCVTNASTYNTSTFILLHNSHATLDTFVQLKIQTIVSSRAFSPESLPILIGPISSRFLMHTSNKNWLIVLFSHGTQTSSELCQQFPKSKSQKQTKPQWEWTNKRQPKNRGVPKSLLPKPRNSKLGGDSETNMFRCLSQSASTKRGTHVEEGHICWARGRKRKSACLSRAI